METAMQDSFDHIPFVGRVDCLLALEKAWGKKQLFGIYGLRAVGKSRTVAEFLKQKGCRFRDQGHGGNQCENNPENVLHVLTIDMREIKAKEVLYAVLFSEISCLSAKMRDGNISDSDIRDEVISILTETFFLTGPVIIFDNAEDTMEGQLKDDLLILCTTLVRKSESIKIFITSTTNALFAQLRPIFFMQELAPMTMQESSTLMRNVLPDTDLGDYFDQITDMCCGLPLAILMVGSTMQDNIKPRDMLASLSECRLKAFNFAGHNKKFDPGVRIKYCKILMEEMEKIAKQIDSREYAEALAVFSLEYPNLRKLLRLLSVHENTKEDTYPFMIQISSTCSSLIEKFLAADSEKFYDCSLKLASQYGKVRDEAIIKIAYGSMSKVPA